MTSTQAVPNDVNDLLLQLYRLSQDLPIASFQDAALSLLKHVLPFDASMWGTATGTAGGIDIHTIHLHQKSPEMLAAYEPLKHLDVGAAAMFGMRRPTRGLHADVDYGAPELGEFREFLRVNGQETLFITADNNPRTGFLHWITLFRADRHAHCTEAERMLLAQLAPHVMQSLAMNRVMHLDRLEAADRALSPHGAAIADLRGVIYHADPQFLALARSEWNDWDGAAIPGALLEHLLQGHHRFLGRGVVIRWYEEQRLLFLKARVRCRADLLTAREHGIAQLIMRGETYKQIAQTLQRSPATVRNQIQVIYEKLQVGSIAAMIEEMRLAE